MLHSQDTPTNPTTYTFADAQGHKVEVWWDTQGSDDTGWAVRRFDAEGHPWDEDSLGPATREDPSVADWDRARIRQALIADRILLNLPEGVEWAAVLDNLDWASLAIRENLDEGATQTDWIRDLTEIQKRISAALKALRGEA